MYPWTILLSIKSSLSLISTFYNVVQTMSLIYLYVYIRKVEGVRVKIIDGITHLLVVERS